MLREGEEHPGNAKTKCHDCNASLLLTALLFGVLLHGCNGKPPEPHTIGVILTAEGLVPALDGFKSGMTQLGYAEDENVTYSRVEFSRIDSLGIAAEHALPKGVDLLFAIGNSAALQARQITKQTETPVVFCVVIDPVETGIVESLRRPGGNLTGIRSVMTSDKALELLLAIAPEPASGAVLYEPEFTLSPIILEVVQRAADTLGVKLVPYGVRTPEEGAAIVASLPDDTGFIFNALVTFPIHSAVNLAAMKRGLPTGSQPLAYARLGTIITFGGEFFDIGRQAARLADQVLRGTPPRDLPVENNAVFLRVNLQAAERAGIEIPDTILRQAHSVIR